MSKTSVSESQASASETENDTSKQQRSVASKNKLQSMSEDLNSIPPKNSPNSGPEKDTSNQKNSDARSSTSVSSSSKSEKNVDGELQVDGKWTTNSQDNSIFADNLSRSSESGKSVDLCSQKSPETQSVKSTSKVKSNEKKEKKKSSWYNMLNPTYKSRSDDFKTLFKDLPDSERLIVDYSCALQKDILVQGRLYISQNYICFYANIFRWETFVTIKCRDVTSMTKEKTARVIPNAIQISTDTEKHFFTSFGARDKTFLMLFRIWQNALLEQPMSSQELWQWVHYSYGEELGLTSDDDDYVAPLIVDEDLKITRNSDQSLLKDDHKSDPNLLDIANELLIEDESETGNEVCVFDPPPPSVSEEAADKSSQNSESKNIPTLKSTEYPTDMSGTTESEENIEESEFKCPCVSHEGKEVLNDVFPLSVDQVFALIFTGSKFYNDLLESRKTYDIMQSPWQITPEFDLKMRQVTYTLTLNHSMAKSAQTTETQRLLKHSKPGQVYTVDCDVVNTGIPYSDAFTVKSVYCLTSVSKRETRLRISGCVRYKKSVWGLVKSLIEKSAMQGLADFATDLASALRKESEISSQQPLTKKTRRRKRIKLEPLKCETLKDAPRILQRQATMKNIGTSVPVVDFSCLSTTPDIVIRVILITLVILLFLNMLLFYKLWSLEDQSSKQVPFMEYSDSQSLTKEDYINLLQKQDSLHRAETERWREALTEVIKLIHLIEKSLSELKSSIDTYSSTSILKTIALRMSQTTEEASTSEEQQQ
ncbi:protein Aster-B [Parasteatoda tepidariorum]|nr:protein Aster-B [Parasteatoda tepidariorum]XP_021003694.1 protein Aster-B [Parasteatoda tepidariorum]